MSIHVVVAFNPNSVTKGLSITFYENGITRGELNRSIPTVHPIHADDVDAVHFVNCCIARTSLVQWNIVDPYDNSGMGIQLEYSFNQPKLRFVFVDGLDMDVGNEQPKTMRLVWHALIRKGFRPYTST